LRPNDTEAGARSGRPASVVPPVLQAFLFFCAAFYIYVNYFKLPRTPILRTEDYLMYLTEAEGMMRGEVIYRDFFQFLTPGIDFTYYVLFTFFGPTALTVNVSVVVLGLCSTVLVFYISSKILRGYLAYAPPLLYLGISLYFSLSANHHSFSMFFVMAAVAAVADIRTPRRLLFAGLFCAAASFFLQTRGIFAMAGVACFSLWADRLTVPSGRELLRNQLVLWTGFAAALAALLSFFVWNAGWRAFIDCTVVFPWRYYPKQGDFNTWRVYMTDYPPLMPLLRRLPTFLAWCFIHAAMPLVYVLAIYRCVRREALPASRPASESANVVLVSVVGLALCAEIAPAPSFGRMVAVSFPGLIVLTWLLRQPSRAPRTMLGAALALAVIFISAGSWWRQRAPVARLPAGEIAFSDVNLYDECVWLATRTKPGDFFLDDQYVRFPMALRNPGRVPFVTGTAYTTPEQADEVLWALQRYSLPCLLMDPAEEEGALEQGNSIHPIFAYIRAHYRRVKVFGDGVEGWERRSSQEGAAFSTAWAAPPFLSAGNRQPMVSPGHPRSLCALRSRGLRVGR
jgi:hypothetical protein